MTINYNELKSIIENNKNFVITSHLNPDGDAIGSEIALARFLERINKNATIINHSPTPSNLTFLHQYFPVNHYEENIHNSLIANADTIIVVDANNLERIGSINKSIEKSNAIKICIDHHLEPSKFADHYFIDSDSTATGEILFKIFEQLTNNKIDKEIATALYTAISTDSGLFKYPKTDAETHNIVAQLINYGADPVFVNEQVYEQNSINRIKLLGTVLSNIKIEYEGRLAYLTITSEMFKNTDTSVVDTEEFVPYTLSIKGVQIGLMFTEIDDKVRISFRSKGDIYINQLAKEFGGNGHKNAAGARISNKKIDDVVLELLTATKKYLI